MLKLLLHAADNGTATPNHNQDTPGSVQLNAFYPGVVGFSGYFYGRGGMATRWASWILHPTNTAGEFVVKTAFPY